MTRKRPAGVAQRPRQDAAPCEVPVTTPRMSLEDQAVIEEAMDQLSDVLMLARGHIDADACSPAEAVDLARGAMAAARKVLARYRRRHAIKRPAAGSGPT